MMSAGTNIPFPTHALGLHGWEATNELQQIVAQTPLLTHFSRRTNRWDNWALIFRDHYERKSLAFLLAMIRSGFDPSWIQSYSKGDKTEFRHEFHAVLTRLGVTSGTLDNTVINAPETHGHALRKTNAQIAAFVAAAHAEGRRVLVIDDGGLIAQGFGSSSSPHRVDAAIELTVSGLRRIAEVDDVAIPIANMASSEVKIHLGYREIADSCVRRIKELLPQAKFSGRTVLLGGYGTLGALVAPLLRAQGCHVVVYDQDPLRLICAAEAGFATDRSLPRALHAHRPFLVVGATGGLLLTPEDCHSLPDGVVLAPLATRDFSCLAKSKDVANETVISNRGISYEFKDGRTCLLLGDGRSVNLFESEGIPEQGYDAFRAATLIVAKELCDQVEDLPSGVLDDNFVNPIVRGSGLYDLYLDRYVGDAPKAIQSIPRTTPCNKAQPTSALIEKMCIVGYGNAGRLHEGIARDLVQQLFFIDPRLEGRVRRPGLVGD